MEYLGIASRADAARYRSDIVVSVHLSRGGADVKVCGDKCVTKR